MHRRPRRGLDQGLDQPSSPTGQPGRGMAGLTRRTQQRASTRPTPRTAHQLVEGGRGGSHRHTALEGGPTSPHFPALSCIGTEPPGLDHCRQGTVGARLSAVPLSWVWEAEGKVSGGKQICSCSCTRRGSHGLSGSASQRKRPRAASWETRAFPTWARTAQRGPTQAQTGSGRPPRVPVDTPKCPEEPGGAPSWESGREARRVQCEGQQRGRPLVQAWRERAEARGACVSAGHGPVRRRRRLPKA